jgi:hypothetical protein
VQLIIDSLDDLRATSHPREKQIAPPVVCSCKGSIRSRAYEALLFRVQRADIDPSVLWLIALYGKKIMAAIWQEKRRMVKTFMLRRVEECRGSRLDATRWDNKHLRMFVRG